MMNTSSSPHSNPMPLPIDSLMYRDVASPDPDSFDLSPAHDALANSLSAQELETLIRTTRSSTIAETETRIADVYLNASANESAKILHAIDLFQIERKDYFARVESDVVHLALAIAAKILHREAQVDTMLIAGLVRVAVDKLHDGSTVSIRVNPSEIDKWKSYFATPSHNSIVLVIGDDHLALKDCILETDLGSASFSIEAQLKEIEQGFFDLLAQRPAIK
jgi:flagellar assembly protein FliH